MKAKTPMNEDAILSGYDLSRQWFDFCFENPELIRPNHTALYFFAIEHCNRLGWKYKFGFPTSMAMEALGIKSYNTFKNTLEDLVKWGFIKMVERSKNQYSANIIALSKNIKALDKALDKALIKHASKQRESTHQSIDSIDKQETIEQLTINNEQEKRVPENLTDESKQVLEALMEKFGVSEMNDYPIFTKLHLFVSVLQSRNEIGKLIKQAKAYWIYKEKSGDKTHGPLGFIGTIEKKYEDGGWCADNWVHKLNNYKQQNNGSGKHITGLHGAEADDYAARKAAKLRRN